IRTSPVSLRRTGGGPAPAPTTSPQVLRAARHVGRGGNGDAGPWPTAEAFLAEGPFRQKQRLENNNDLTVSSAWAAERGPFRSRNASKRGVLQCRYRRLHPSRRRALFTGLCAVFPARIS